MILQHPQFTEKFNACWGRPHANPIVVETSDARSMDKFREKEWYILREGNNYGPYSYVEVIQMLQVKNLFEYDFIWQPGFAAWKRVAEVSEFAAEKIKDLLHSQDPAVSEVFFRRRHARAKYGCSLIVHDNKSVHKGRSVEISVGGAGIIVFSHHLQPGQSLFLHFQPGDGVPPFNAIAMIVSKQFVKSGSVQEVTSLQVRYGIKFTSISQNIRESIKVYTDKKSPGVRVA